MDRQTVVVGVQIEAAQIDLDVAGLAVAVLRATGSPTEYRSGIPVVCPARYAEARRAARPARRRRWCERRHEHAERRAARPPRSRRPPAPRPRRRATCGSPRSVASRTRIRSSRHEVHDVDSSDRSGRLASPPRCPRPAQRGPDVLAQVRQVDAAPDVTRPVRARRRDRVGELRVEGARRRSIAAAPGTGPRTRPRIAASDACR